MEKTQTNPLNIKIKYFDRPDYTQPRLQKITKGDWIDCYASKDVFVPTNTATLIPLGFAMQLPENYEAHMVSRSSTYKNWKILQTNAHAVIDNSLCGDNDEWLFAAISLDPNGSLIRKGDRICQFRIIEKMPAITFEEVEKIRKSRPRQFWFYRKKLMKSNKNKRRE